MYVLVVLLWFYVTNNNVAQHTFVNILYSIK